MIIDGHIRRDTLLVLWKRRDWFVSKTPSSGTFVIKGVIDPNLAISVRGSRRRWGVVVCWRSRLLRLLESARKVRRLLVLGLGHVGLVPIAAVVAPRIVSWVLCAQSLRATVRTMRAGAL